MTHPPHNSDIARVRAALRAIPDLNLAGVDLAGLDLAPITPLSGTSNLTFKVALDGGPLVVRLAQNGIGSYANRWDELAACRLAMRLGIGPALRYAEPEGGILVFDHVDAAPAPGFDNAGAGLSFLQRMGAALGSLHRCGETLPGRFDVVALIEKYTAALAMQGPAAAPQRPRTVVAALATAQDRLARLHRPLAPCHNDPVPENFLDLGDQAMLVDWEYAGMNDPAFDLAYLSLEAGLDAAAEQALLEAHGDAALHAPVVPLYKFLACAMGGLWARLHPPDSAWRAWGRERDSQAAALARSLFS